MRLEDDWDFYMWQIDIIKTYGKFSFDKKPESYPCWIEYQFEQGFGHDEEYFRYSFTY